ncbi:defensin Ec-AMP-D1 [Medicago truncatula]|uniref:Defensin MtDef4.3 n=2 Tax=Medicago truncatula TaxID=3880 RepID=G7L737_MEDTR|nr:defensin Ec-AMP-D1 [Medicago truncatula]AET03454.1 Defensin MtDef4.3 [Medicago truncatula]
MARSVSLVSTIFVFFLLIVATEMGPSMVAARTCETPSNSFKGACFSDTNCASVCQTEGFPGGHCKGFRQRCFCTKPC